MKKPMRPEVEIPRSLRTAAMAAAPVWILGGPFLAGAAAAVGGFIYGSVTADKEADGAKASGDVDADRQHLKGRAECSHDAREVQHYDIELAEGTTQTEPVAGEEVQAGRAECSHDARHTAVQLY